MTIKSNIPEIYNQQDDVIDYRKKNTSQAIIAIKIIKKALYFEILLQDKPFYYQKIIPFIDSVIKDNFNCHGSYYINKEVFFDNGIVIKTFVKRQGKGILVQFYLNNRTINIKLNK